MLMLPLHSSLELVPQFSRQTSLILQIRYPPEVDASLQGFAYGIGGIFDTELRRSFESPNELRSADDPIGSIIPQASTDCRNFRQSRFSPAEISDWPRLLSSFALLKRSVERSQSWLVLSNWSANPAQLCQLRVEFVKWEAVQKFCSPGTTLSIISYTSSLCGWHEYAKSAGANFSEKLQDCNVNAQYNVLQVAACHLNTSNLLLDRKMAVFTCAVRCSQSNQIWNLEALYPCIWHHS